VIVRWYADKRESFKRPVAKRTSAKCSLRNIPSERPPHLVLSPTETTGFGTTCVVASTAINENTEPKYETAELYAVLQNGYIPAAMTAQAQPHPHNAHATVYSAVKAEPRIRGITVIRLPRMEMTLLCRRFQKSASDVCPVPGVLMAMLKAKYPGMSEAMKKKAIRAVNMMASLCAQTKT
jgi:hypothetical protein